MDKKLFIAGPSKRRLEVRKNILRARERGSKVGKSRERELTREDALRAGFIESKLTLILMESTSKISGTWIYEGGAKGVDKIAREWAKKVGAHYLIFNADWEKHGKFAGPRRNFQMLQAAKQTGKPVLVAGFPAINKPSRGTWDCLKQAASFGIECRVWGVKV